MAPTGGPDVGHRQEIMKSAPLTKRTILCLAFLLVLVGVVFRLLMIREPFGVVNSDEAMAGLMARGIRNGHFTSFYWGQNYGGSFEAYILAILGLIIPEHIVFFFLPIVESIFIAFLLFQISKANLGRDLSFLVASLSFVFPALTVWNSARPMLFYQSTIILGLTSILIVSKKTRPISTANWIFIGVLFGFGWWGSAQSLFFIVPCFVTVLAQRNFPSIRQFGLAIVSFLLASGPWWYTNFHTGFASLSDGPPADGTIRDHLMTQLKIGWPSVFGLRQPFNGEWLHASLPFVFLILLAGSAIYYLPRMFRGRRDPNTLLLVIPTFVILQALAPTGSFVGSGRYYIFVVPSVLVVIGTFFAFLVNRFDRIGKFVVASLVICALISTAMSLRAIRHFQFGPTHLSDVATTLSEHNISGVYGDYWVVYALAWEDSQLKVSPTTTERRPDWSQEIRASQGVAYVFWTEYSVDLDRLESTKVALGLRTQFDEIHVGTYVLLLPQINIPPEDL
ncbi:unannotated protein [freshwater metagenome]|uniref:Unannotated protein n=1 Tax=freshwater metagenome TaxID=449393 RepID=A0A6J7FCB6_9ZZZZ